MSCFIKGLKNNFRSFDFKSLRQVTISFLAAFFLFSTTACGGPDLSANTMPKDLDSSSPHNITELRKPPAPPIGGMNDYSDVDPRVDTSQAKAKADRLIKQTKELQQKDPNPFNQVRKNFDKKGLPERAEDLSDRLNRSAQETIDGVSKSTEKGFENLQENTKSFKDDVGSTVDQLGQKAMDKADDLKNAAQKNADRVTNKDG